MSNHRLKLSNQNMAEELASPFSAIVINGICRLATFKTVFTTWKKDIRKAIYNHPVNHRQNTFFIECTRHEMQGRKRKGMAIKRIIQLKLK